MDIIVTDEFRDWYEDVIDDQAARDVYRVVGLLEAKGVTLGFPYSSSVEGSSIALRELRVQSGGRPIRIFYAYDPKRNAVLLLGGDKAGDDRFYDRMIPKAEKLWQEYLDELD